MPIPISNGSLDGAQRDTLRAVINRIIPADDFPDAWDAGVGEYILRLLAGDARDLAPFVAAGLAAVNAEALAAVSAEAPAARGQFADLAAAEQDRLLGRIEQRDTRTAWPVDAGQWFALLVRLANEGYYADPANGGNINGMSWTMLGFDPRVPPVTES